jgi:hypothetical protein
MKITDMVLAPELMKRPRIDYRSVYAWMPVRTVDEGLVWLERVWKITDKDTGQTTFSLAILPFLL